MRFSVLLLCALALAAPFACKPEEDRRSPPSSGSPTATQTQFNPYATATAGAQGTHAAIGNNGQGVGCNGDAEPVPTDASAAALRACCDKLMKANACQGSQCWAKNVLEGVKKQMEAGGKCAAQ